MKTLVTTLAVVAALALPACSSSAPPHAHAAAASTPAPSPSSHETEITLTPKGGCADEADWRDSGGMVSLRKLSRALGRVADDETSANTAALSDDGARLYAVALAAEADPPPMDRGKWVRAMRLAQRAAVGAQSGDYQASDTAITETADLLSVMNSDLTAQCEGGG